MIHKLIPNTDPILHTKTEPFNFSNPQMDPIKLMEDLRDTMQHCRGVGLSANQVGIPLSVWVFGNPDIRSSIVCFFNPKIVDTSDDLVYMQEGCLSYPGLYFKVKRPTVIKVRFADEKGDVETFPFEGATARVIQHEVDHLNGIVFTSKANKYHLDKAKNQLKRINRLKKTKIV